MPGPGPDHGQRGLPRTLQGIHPCGDPSVQPRDRTEARALALRYAALLRPTAAALLTTWLGACQATEPPPPDPERDRLRALGNTRFRQARFRDALSAYRQALALDTLSAQAHYNLATAYMKVGRTDSAETAYRAALRLDSTFVPAYHNLAVAYGERGRHPEAVDLLEEALRIDPGAAASYRLLAGLHQERGAYDRAEAALVRAVEADSADAEALSSLGRLLRLQGRPAESEEMLRRAVRFDPGSKEAHRELGILFTWAERYDEAEGMLRRALEIDPDWPEACHSLANLHSARGRVEEARILLDRFAELTRRASRVRALEKQVNQAAGGLDSYLAAGRSYGELGRWQEAAGMYRAVLEREPGHVGGLAGLSHARLNQGDLDEAVALAGQVIARAPDWREACAAHYTIGYAAVRKGRLPQARQAFEQALQVDTTYARAHHALGNVALLQGRPGEAEQSYRAAIRHRPDWAEPRLSLGQHHLRQRDYGQAIEMLQAALRLEPADARAYLALGGAWEKLGKAEAAGNAYRSAAAHWRGDARRLAVIEARLARLAR